MDGCKKKAENITPLISPLSYQDKSIAVNLLKTG